jgi:hypothetical protein
MEMKKTLSAVSAAVILAGGLVAFSQPASAHVVCNREGDCWSTHANVQYPSAFGIRTYNVMIVTPTRAIDSVIGMTMVGHGAMKTMIVTVALIAAAPGFSFSA